MSVRLKIIKEVKRMADIISGNSRFGDVNNSKNKKLINLVPEEQKQEENLDENEIIRIYGKRWDIEVFLKVCKSHLNLSREFNDNRSLGELFYTFQMKCSISHGYRLFKCCFKCSGQCFQTTPNFQIKKSTN